VGSVSKLKSGKYRARYRDPDGVQHARHFDKKTDADRWLTTMEASKLDGSYVDPMAGKQTFGALADLWLDRQVHRPSTRAQVASHMSNHIRPAFENRRVASIKPSDIQSFVKGLSEKLAPSTVEVIYVYTASVFRSAVDDRILAHSPCRASSCRRRSGNWCTLWTLVWSSPSQRQSSPAIRLS